jgi:hypothetical protein
VAAGGSFCLLLLIIVIHVILQYWGKNRNKHANLVMVGGEWKCHMWQERSKAEIGGNGGIE